MTWIGLTAGIYIKPLSDTEFYAISPQGVTAYRLVKHTTDSVDAELIGSYPNPQAAMYAAQKAHSAAS